MGRENRLRPTYSSYLFCKGTRRFPEPYAQTRGSAHEKWVTYNPQIKDSVEIQDGKGAWIKFTGGDIEDIRKKLLERKRQKNYDPLDIEGQTYRLQSRQITYKEWINEILHKEAIIRDRKDGLPVYGTPLFING